MRYVVLFLVAHASPVAAKAIRKFTISNPSWTSTNDIRFLRKSNEKMRGKANRQTDSGVGHKSFVVTLFALNVTIW